MHRIIAMLIIVLGLAVACGGTEKTIPIAPPFDPQEATCPATGYMENCGACHKG